MICVFVQFRCAPGQTYHVAEAVYDREVVSELYSTSGDYDLIAKVYIPDGEDVGRYLSDRLFDIPGIQRTLTTMTFKAFCPRLEPGGSSSSNGERDIGIAVPREQGIKPGCDFRHQRYPLIDHRGVNLHGRCACAYLFIGLLGRSYTANPDKREKAVGELRQTGQDSCRLFEQWGPRKAPNFAATCRFQTFALKGRVRGDDPGHLGGKGHVDDVLQLARRKVGSDLQEDRDRARKFKPRLHHLTQKRGQQGSALQVAQAFGVRRA